MISAFVLDLEKQRSVFRPVDPILFQANQSWLINLDDAPLAEKQQYQFYSVLIWLDWGSNPVYCTQCEHGNHDTTNQINTVLKHY